MANGARVFLCGKIFGVGKSFLVQKPGLKFEMRAVLWYNLRVKQLIAEKGSDWPVFYFAL